MEFLANYDDGENSNSNTSSPSKKFDKTAMIAPSLQAEWESFEKMISDGTDEFGHDTKPVSKDHYLIDGIVAYPGMPSLNKIPSTSKTQDSPEKEETPLPRTERSPPRTERSPPRAEKSPPRAETSPQRAETSPGLETKKGRSLADDVMKLLGSSSYTEELDSLPRPRSRSRSSDSSESSDEDESRSASPSSSPERKSAERDVSKTEEEKTERKDDKSKGLSRGRTESTTSVSSAKSDKAGDKRYRSRSHSPKRRKSRSPHSSRKRSRSSRSRERRRSKDRKDHSSRKKHRHSRSRSKERHHKKERRSSRERRRRRSKDRKRRSRSRDRRRKHGRRHRSKSSHRRRHRRSRSRDKSRSRSRSPTHDKPRESHADTERASFSRKEDSDKHLTFKEKMRQQLLKASKYLQSGEALEGLGMDGKPLEMPKEKPSNLPLNEKNFFAEMAASTKSNVTPQVALLHTMAAMHQKAQEMTGVAVPKYYNPAAVNPLKYAEQVQKRKLLWSKAKDHKEDKEKEWSTSAFSADQNGKMAAKFRKLMGIKEDEKVEGETPVGEMTDEQIQKQQELFSRLDKEYEFARMTTHTHRGVGLGFSSQGFQPPPNT